MSLLPPRRKQTQKDIGRSDLDRIERIMEQLIGQKAPITNEVLKYELLQIVRDYRWERFDTMFREPDDS